MKPIIVLFSLVLAAFSSSSFDPAKYSDSKDIVPGVFHVFWSVDTEREEVKIALKVKTLGWFGFGLGEMTTGSMPGSDIVTIEFDENDKAEITDRYAIEFAAPLEDNCQNWDLEASYLENGDTRIVEIIRSLDTGDDQDRVFQSGSIKVVVAYGQNNQPKMTYHDSRRAASEISFYKVASTPPIPTYGPDVKVKEYYNNASIRTARTIYTCHAFEVPLSEGDEDHHIVQIDPIIDPASTAYAHHMLVHICHNITGSYVGKYFNNPQECYSPIGNVYSGCTSLLFGWAVGSGPLYLPEAAGFRIGMSRPAFRYVILEMHYNNPDLVPGITDNSGFKIYYTPNLRQHDAAMITLGDPFTSLATIPPLIKSYEYELECPSECTQKFQHEINVFADFLHMHMIGSKMWSRQWRNGEDLGLTNRAEFYSFDFQQLTTVNYTIKPGDRINTHCVYDSRVRTEDTKFGPASEDEMCMNFLAYYPRLDVDIVDDFAYCGYINLEAVTGESGNGTVCGGLSHIASDLILKDLANPRSVDPNDYDEITFGLGETKCRNKTVVIVVGLILAFAVLSIVFGVYYWYRKRSKYTAIDEKVSM